MKTISFEDHQQQKCPDTEFPQLDKMREMAMCEVREKCLLHFVNVRRLETPVPYRGRQGIFYVPDRLVV